MNPNSPPPPPGPRGLFATLLAVICDTDRRESPFGWSPLLPPAALDPDRPPAGWPRST